MNVLSLLDDPIALKGVITDKLQLLADKDQAITEISR